MLAALSLVFSSVSHLHPSTSLCNLSLSEALSTLNHHLAIQNSHPSPRQPPPKPSPQNQHVNPLHSLLNLHLQLPLHQPLIPLLHTFTPPPSPLRRRYTIPISSIPRNHTPPLLTIIVVLIPSAHNPLPSPGQRHPISRLVGEVGERAASWTGHCAESASDDAV